jgi:hypothetical protein
MSDKKPIIKILFYKPKDAYFGLSPEERKQLAIKTAKDVTDVGGRWLTRCDCYWADEEWVQFGVMEFPDIEAVQKHARFIADLEQFKYIESKSYLGTPMEQS